MLTSRLLVVPALAAWAFCGGAQAHPRLLSSTPAVNATVASPHMIQLKFSERLIGAMTGADVVAAPMRAMPGMSARPAVKTAGFTHTLSADGKSLVLQRKAGLAPGAYQVVWHAVSVDTHRVAGRFAFSVK